MQPVSNQWLGKHVPAETNARNTVALRVVGGDEKGPQCLGL
jgi:hypothetical protein